MQCKTRQGQDKEHGFAFLRHSSSRARRGRPPARLPVPCACVQQDADTKNTLRRSHTCHLAWRSLACLRCSCLSKALALRRRADAGIVSVPPTAGFLVAGLPTNRAATGLLELPARHDSPSEIKRASIYTRLINTTTPCDTPSPALPSLLMKMIP